MFTLLIARSSFGREFQSVGAATIKTLSPNVFDRTAGIESKILSDALRLYKDDLNVSNNLKSHRYLGERPCIALNLISSILNCIRASTGSQCRP